MRTIFTKQRGGMFPGTSKYKVNATNYNRQKARARHSGTLQKKRSNKMLWVVFIIGLLLIFG